MNEQIVTPKGNLEPRKTRTPFLINLEFPYDSSAGKKTVLKRVKKGYYHEYEEAVVNVQKRSDWYLVASAAYGIVPPTTWGKEEITGFMRNPIIGDIEVPLQMLKGYSLPLKDIADIINIGKWREFIPGFTGYRENNVITSGGFTFVALPIEKMLKNKQLEPEVIEPYYLSDICLGELHYTVEYNQFVSTEEYKANFEYYQLQAMIGDLVF